MREEPKTNMDEIKSGSLCSARKVLFLPVIIARATEAAREELLPLPLVS